MKKIFSFIAFVLIAFAAQAEEDVVLLPTKAQVGTTAKVGVVVKHDAAKGPAAGIIFYYSIPDGTTLSGITALGGGSGDYNPVNCKASYDGYEALTTANPDGAVICTLDIEIPKSMALGEYPVALTDIQVVYEDGITDFTIDRTESTITVQKTAVIEPQNDLYAYNVIPFVMPKDATYSKPFPLTIHLTNDAVIYNSSFKLSLPEGIKIAQNVYYDEDEEDYVQVYKKPELVASRMNNVYVNDNATLTLTQKVTASGAEYNLISTGGGFKKSASAGTPAFTIYLQADPAIADGVYNLKMSDIKISTKDDANTYTGEYMATVIVGQPKASEAILYGNYDETTASAFSKALRNVAFANTTAATFAEGALLEDVILTKDNTNITFYTRTAENFATTVLPYDLQESPNATLYTAKEMSEEDGIILEETDFVAANTPCIFKGTITATGEFVPILDGDDIIPQTVGTIDFKGTYEPIYLEPGAGYYISGGYFYNDGASISPFRAYFDGTIAGVKSFSVKVDTPNGLIDITDQLSDEAIYSLQGIRVQNAQKGINIKGGKKVYVK